MSSVLGIGQNKSRNLKDNSSKGEDRHNPKVRESSQGQNGYSKRRSSPEATYTKEVTLRFFKIKKSSGDSSGTV